ncbi:MAG: discoidin domain-containing protein [Planctomycetota bacterium]|nr:discoidin domain-containing protein [Planctomycetota bacterium]
MAKLICLVLLAVALCFGPSCEKAEEPEPAPSQPAAPAPASTQEPSTAAQLADAAKEEVKEVVEEVKEAVTAGAEMAPLDIKLPKPMFVGTPQDTRVANLRKPTGKARPPFLAPVGAQLLSLNKPVSASDEEPIIGDIEMITDGDKEAADGSYVELGPFLQWVQVDLEQEAEIAAIVVWHYHKQPRVYFDVVVQISNDKDFITGVTTVFNNDIDNSSGLGIGTDMHYTETSEGELIDCVSQGTPKGRYVRLYSNGNTSNDLNHYIEVDVYGKPVQ